MDEHTEWWRMLTRLSPFWIPVASAIVVLLIRDLLAPRQWQRYVRKTLASAIAGILVFAIIATGYILFILRVGVEDSPLAIFATVVVGLGLFPATAFAVSFVFDRVEPDLDWYMSSRFVHSFQNRSWPTLSMDVRPECLPEDATSISGCIAAVRENVGEYHLKVVVGIGSDARTVLDGTTRNPWQGWMRVMRAVLKAQLGDLQENREWQERLHISGRLREWLEILIRTRTPTTAAQYKWQNGAYMQIHRLAQRMDARGVLC